MRREDRLIWQTVRIVLLMKENPEQALSKENR